MGSASQPMLVVKANRALVKKRRSYSEIREAYKGYARDIQLEFKELTPFEQKKIRDRIIAQARRDKIQEIKHFVYAFLVLCFLALITYLVFF
ncbi:hypothetical protein ACOKFD_11245 [Flagellimonas sp. S174]|uniref:hypothetical protein n=1 Tax=Flagellimonas sp. S174 TaxID=3410790 RepID=UPI003BF54218